MSREALTEVLMPHQTRMSLIESVGADASGALKLRGIGIQGDVRNQNGRIYPKEEIARAVKEMSERIKQHGPLPGECDHPDNMTIALDRITHLIDDIRMEGANGIVEMRIVPTVLGQSVMTMVKHGLQIGVSSRGTGEVDGDGRVSNFEILTIDMVANPSAPDAYPKPVLESLMSTTRGRGVLTMAEALKEDVSAQKHFQAGVLDFINNVLNAKGTL